MHFGIEIIPFGTYADPREIVKLAVAAEKAGWEALFVWDHLGFVWGAASADPWVSLAACAQATNRIKLGTAVTPLPRRRPHLVAATLVSLDRLSGGRVIFGAGLGGVEMEFTAFGEPAGARVRAEMLDEGLELIDRLLCGEPVTHLGKYFTADDVQMAPLPQQDHIPFWIGGESRSALQRAAHWDGWIVTGIDQNYRMIKSPQDIVKAKNFITANRSKTSPFDIAMSGKSDPGQRQMIHSYTDAGVTWWLESMSDLRGTQDQLLERIAAGPVQ